MKKLISYFTATLTALTLGVLSFGAVAQAQPLAVAHSAVLQDITSAKQGLSQNVQYYPERRQYRDRPNYGRRYDRPRPHYRPQYRPGYRSHYRPSYRPHYRPGYRPYYQQQYRPYYRPAPPRYYRDRRY